jgi:hypothetical protein
MTQATRGEPSQRRREDQRFRRQPAIHRPLDAAGIERAGHDDAPAQRDQLGKAIESGPRAVLIVRAGQQRVEVPQDGDSRPLLQKLD